MPTHPYKGINPAALQLDQEPISRMNGLLLAMQSLHSKPGSPALLPYISVRYIQQAMLEEIGNIQAIILHEKREWKLLPAKRLVVIQQYPEIHDSYMHILVKIKIRNFSTEMK